MSPAARRELRLALVSRIPRRYSPRFHLLFPLLVGLGIVAAALHLLHHVGAVQVAAVPFFVLVANGPLRDLLAGTGWRRRRALARAERFDTDPGVG